VELRQGFIEMVSESIEETGVVDFETVTDFWWTRIVIIAPYTSVRDVMDASNVGWRRRSRRIETSDEHTLILFVNENRTIGYVYFPRNIADFSQFVQGRGWSSFDRGNAVFTFNDNIRGD
jgi:hypothetical protein